MWSYDECNAVNTDTINWKEYKSTGQFYHDVNTLLKLFGIKRHPSLEDPYGDSPDAHEQRKEPSCLTFNKFRLDNNTMKLLFKVLEGCPHI